MAETEVDTSSSDAFLYDIAEKTYPGWQTMQTNMGKTFHNPGLGLYVILTGKIIDGKHWVIVSVARKNRSPSIADIDLAKKTFLGEDKNALLILPSPTKPSHFSVKSTTTWTRILVYCAEGDNLPIFF